MSQPETPLESFWRSIIMLGTVIVTGMALYLYGPPPEKAMAMATQLVERVTEAIDEQTSGQSVASASSVPALPAPASPALASPNGLASTPQAFSHFETPAAVPQFGALRPNHASAEDPQVASLAAELTRLGAENVDLATWGDSGQFHRCCFTVPVAGSLGFRRHFQTIQPTQVDAMAVALAELRDWRIASAAPISRGGGLQ